MIVLRKQRGLALFRNRTFAGKMKSLIFSGTCITDIDPILGSNVPRNNVCVIIIQIINECRENSY